MRFPSDFMPRLITDRNWTDKIDIVIDRNIGAVFWRMFAGYDFVFLPGGLPKCRWVQTRGMEVLNPRVASASRGSKAVYLADFGSKEVTLLLQYLPPWSSTSRHCHGSQVKEVYHVLCGRGYLEIGEMPHRLERWHTALVDSGKIHRYYTKELPVLTALEIIGLSVEDCLYSKRDHRYAPSRDRF